MYFDDGTLLGIASITNGSGTNFDDPATPSNLPGGSLASPAFVATAGFSADSGLIVDGVNPGEFMTVQFNLLAGVSFADTLAALSDGRLRIGILGQGFAIGTSDSFINMPLSTPTPVPEPAMLPLVGAALVALSLYRRRKG